MGRDKPRCGQFIVCLLFIISGVSVIGVASFSETEQGQVTVVTSHGAETGQHLHGHEREKEKEVDKYASEEATQLASIGNDNDGRNEAGAEDRGGLSRQRRFMSQGDQWPKGIVPFDFNPSISEYYRKEALAAMTKFHKYTCIRFVPWLIEATKAKYDLPLESHVTITKGDGCAAHQGNIRSASGQYNSCCSRGICIHELGHTLGLWHEHQNPLQYDVMKKDWAKINFDMGWTYRTRALRGLDVYQYDTGSTMHYGGSAFKILYEDLRPLISFSNQYYMYKDTSTYHSCKELYCSGVSQQCHNDGFLTLVDDQCSCLCPPGLDPTTGCTTVVKQVTTSSQWPKGLYAIMSPSTGCPGNNEEFSRGSWAHKGKGGNLKSDYFNLAGTFESDTFEYEFCVKNDNSSSTGPDWETGRYCILRVGGACPDGFEDGFIQYDDADDTPQTKTGSLPDGDFNADTRLEFCCRDDGFTSVPLANLPNTQPLMLLLAQGEDCQEIAGMRWTEEYFRFESFPEKAAKNGTHPHVTSGTTFRIWFCYYVPTNTDCGGEITLTRDNRQAVITSPHYPVSYGNNIECNWLIKAAEPDARVLVNFDEMKVSTLNGDCRDSLEIRYNIPGQPGIRYCGDGIGRTIRSINDTVILTLRSDRNDAAEDTGFNLTASLFIPDEDECFDPQTKGKLYRGKKDYTRSMKPCLEWSKVTNCLHHAFKPSGAGLDKNYCRNPDNTAMPWCFTDQDCSRDYCDVCNIERVYNRKATCPDEICLQTRLEVLALGCADHCNLKPPSAPVRTKTCGQPGSLPDATIIESSDQLTASTFNVGDTVTYKCKTGCETLTRTCMSEGEWSPAGYVCGACDVGWYQRDGSCYKYHGDFVNFASAQSTCGKHGAVISSMKDKAEEDFVSSLRPHMWTIWLGATDKEEEGQFVWEDGTPVNWTHWEDGAPNNWNNQDCLEVFASISSNEWNDIDCGILLPFVCKYHLSERKKCVDRNPYCESMLRNIPNTCTVHRDFASQLCPFTCGVCLPDSTPKCPVTSSSQDVELVSPAGETSVTRGTMVTYKCRDGLVVSKGQLVQVCGHDGNLNGQRPVCEDPDKIDQESNTVELIPRSQTTSAGYAYTSFGSSLGITRYGVIKEWKFYSTEPGWTMFQVWRPNPSGGIYSFNIVGQNQVMTLGQGAETQSVQEADWIHVQPGDSIGIMEPSSPRGKVPYDNCNGDEQPEHFGVTGSLKRDGDGDFSPQKAHGFNDDIKCRVYSFKAVIYPNNTVPDSPDMATSQVPLVSRGYVGADKNVYLVDSDNSLLPVYGEILEWQFYVKHSGSAAFQVWRRRADLGVRQYEFIGENKLNLTVDKPGYHTLTIPEGERIDVKTGDIIAVVYDSIKLGVPYSFCNANDNPESYNVYWYEVMTPGTAVNGKVYSFSFSGGSYLCRTFSMRAIVTQNKTAEAEECFEPATKGRLYRGPKDYTRSMKPCLDWTVVTQCPHHAFQASDFEAGLDKNYCRNPGNQLDMPWCYMDSQCNKEYCDVCNVENVIDTATTCSDDVCSRTREQVLTAGCAATCEIQHPPAPVREQGCPISVSSAANLSFATESSSKLTALMKLTNNMEIATYKVGDTVKIKGGEEEATCGQPGIVPDATITDQQTLTKYSVGDTVTYKCHEGGATLTRTCQSEGEWSPAGYVCKDTCADRHPDCSSMLLDIPDTCTAHTDFATDLCRYTCGLCQPDSTPECDIALNSGVELTSPQGQTSVKRGTLVRFACQSGYVLSEGKLLLACGQDGSFIGDLPECTDPNTIIQDSNDVELVQRAHSISSGSGYTSTGSQLSITRYGVIKQWKLFSPTPGWTVFQVWRPNPAGGNFSFVLRGQNQVMTRGQGQETHDVDEGDWIHVQPGDMIGLWEGVSPRGNVRYDWCDKNTQPGGHGVMWSSNKKSFGDFSPLKVQEFNSDVGCRVFSFKAVIYPNDTVPANRDMVTSQVPLFGRGSVGAAVNVYMTDSNSFYIPMDGYVSEWQFYAKYGGSGAFQIWRRREELGVRKYELIGQNVLNLTVDTPHLHSFKVPAGERIPVKTGDIISVLYDSNKLGVPYSFCNANDNPESYNVYWYEVMTPGTAVMGKVYSFSYTGGSYLCRTFSMRAIVTQ